MLDACRAVEDRGEVDALECFEALGACDVTIEDRNALTDKGTNVHLEVVEHACSQAVLRRHVALAAHETVDHALSAVE